MDCVYHAYTDYLRWLGEPVTSVDLVCWKALKWWTHGTRPQYTFGGTVPWIIRRLSSLHDLEMWFEYRVYRPPHLLAVAKEYYKPYYKRLKSIIGHYYFGLEEPEITLAPAIYLLLTGQHAVFSETVPKFGTPILAIQLRR